LDDVCVHLRTGGRLALFLDYDGTLVPISRTPDDAWPDPMLLELLEKLARQPSIRTIILSGRPLFSLQAMLPVSGLVLAGLYGVEIEIPEQGVIRRAQAETVNAVLEQVRDAWAQLIRDHSGFLLEDKGLSVALHSRLADPSEAAAILPKAQAVLTEIASKEFRILGGDRFLEIAPAAAHKGQAVEYLFDRLALRGAGSIYLGDDDKDEEAFAVIRRYNGLPVLVGTRQVDTVALVRLPDPPQARVWLEAIAEAARHNSGT
jgi:trehalose 6-phosphate phosphatase